MFTVTKGNTFLFFYRFKVLHFYTVGIMGMPMFLCVMIEALRSHSRASRSCDLSRASWSSDKLRGMRSLFQFNQLKPIYSFYHLPPFWWTTYRGCPFFKNWCFELISSAVIKIEQIYVLILESLS